MGDIRVYQGHGRVLRIDLLGHLWYHRQIIAKEDAMALRKVSLDHLREIVRARITKGDGFSLSNEEYIARQHEVKTALAEMSREEIIRRWPHHCYDIKG